MKLLEGIAVIYVVIGLVLVCRTIRRQVGQLFLEGPCSRTDEGS
jgi:hypothetical protein